MAKAKHKTQLDIFDENFNTQLIASAPGPQAAPVPDSTTKPMISAILESALKLAEELSDNSFFADLVMELVATQDVAQESLRPFISEKINSLLHKQENHNHYHTVEKLYSHYLHRIEDKESFEFLQANPPLHGTNPDYLHLCLGSRSSKGNMLASKIWLLSTSKHANNYLEEFFTVKNLLTEDTALLAEATHWQLLQILKEAGPVYQSLHEASIRLNHPSEVDMLVMEQQPSLASVLGDFQKHMSKNPGSTQQNQPRP